MADDVVINKAAIIERCVARVREVHAGDDRHVTADLLRQDSIVLNLQRACEASIDLAALLWRPPAQTGGALASGDEGAGVVWLARRLDTISGAAVAGEAALAYDAALAERVREYQRARGLAVDGIAGPAVLLSLDSDPGPGTPTLGAAGGGP